MPYTTEVDRDFDIDRRAYMVFEKLIHQARENAAFEGTINHRTSKFKFDLGLEIPASPPGSTAPPTYSTSRQQSAPMSVDQLISSYGP